MVPSNLCLSTPERSVPRLRVVTRDAGRLWKGEGKAAVCAGKSCPGGIYAKGRNDVGESASFSHSYVLVSWLHGPSPVEEAETGTDNGRGFTAPRCSSGRGT